MGVQVPPPTRKNPSPLAGDFVVAVSFANRFANVGNDWRNGEWSGHVRISRIIIENLRGLPDVDLSVSGHLVLVGPTDAGKTSALRAIHLLIGLAQAQLVPSIELRDFTDPSKPVIVEVTLEDFDDEDRAMFPDQIRVDRDGSESLRLRLEAEIDQADPDLRSVRRTFPDVAGSRQVARAQLDRVGWVLLRSDRSLNRELGSAATGAFKTLLNQADLGDEIDVILEAVNSLHSLLAGSESLTTIRDGVAAGLSAMLPVDVSGDDLLLLTGSDATRSPLADVLLHMTDDDGEPSPISEQSDGVRSVTLLSLFSMAAGQHGLRGIDEPELHLHPAAQRAVGEMLASSQRQHLLATHSGQLASSFPAKDIVVLSRVHGARQLPEGHDAASEQFLWRWWNHELVEVLTSERVLFVEGPSDRILVEAVAAKTGLRLSRNGTRVLELDGADTFAGVWGMLGANGFGIPSIGLCDADREEKWAKILGVEVSELESVGFHVCSPDLEGEVVESLGADRFMELVTASSFVSNRAILDICKITDLADITEERAAKFFRKKKVLVATALASSMTESDAGNIQRVVNLLQEA